MASKSKSGLTAVRQYWEDILVPPNQFTIGAPSFISPVRDGKGHAALHAAVTNDTPGTLNIFQAWQSGGPFVLTDAVITQVDPGGSGLQIADITTPVVRRYVQVQFLPTTVLGGAFELGAYFQPHADSAESSVTGSGPASGSAPPNRNSFATGQLNVAAHGVAQQLPPQIAPNGFAVSIIAKKTNTKNIYLGNTQANAQNHGLADILAAGDVRRLFITNWNLAWIDSDVNGEGVTIISET